MFKDYYGNPIMGDHNHVPEDTPATRSKIDVTGSELLKTTVADIEISYYSTKLTPTITAESSAYIVGASNAANINGIVAIKLQFSTPLVSSKSYLFMLEPVKDTNSIANMINIDFSTASSYDFNKLKYVYEKIARSIDGYSDFKYLYKITPKTDINSMIIYLDIQNLTTNTTKQLLKTTVKEISLGSMITAATVTSTEYGFMSMEDKNKLEIVDISSTFIENVLDSALFYSDDVLPTDQ